MKTMKKKLSSFAWASCLLVILLVACGQPSIPANVPEEAPTKIPTEAVYNLSPTETPPEPTLSPTTETYLEPTSSPMAEIEEIEPIITDITIDGDPSDWESYEVLYTDPEGDYRSGGFDIAAVRAFTNDAYLYVLIETYFPATDFVQLDLDVRSGTRAFVISFWPGTSQSPHMGETTTGEWKDVGEIAGSASALGEAVEVKMPLSYFDEPTDLHLLNVRPMGGQCCGENWYAIDETAPLRIAKSSETEPESGLAELPPRVCGENIASPAPFGSLPPAPITLTETGYSAEWFVAPGPFNMPEEILLTPQGEMLVYAVRGHTLSKLADDGTITLIAREVWGYLGDVDSEGNVYLHMHPDGLITRVTPDGKAKTIVRSPLLRTDCDSGFGLGPDGNLYVAVSRCTDKGDLYRVSLSGQITPLGEVPQLQALRTAPDGRFLATTWSEIYEISMDNYALTSLGKTPGEGISPGGLAVDDAGNIYVSTGSRSVRGEVYRRNADGKFTLLAKVPDNGLSGIEWLPATGEIVGGQLRQGGVIAVSQDGALREIVSGNGIITPMALTFSPCGEMAVPNDDGGMMTLIDPAGEVSWFMDYLSFIPPDPYVAFAPDGTLYASEAAPGLLPVRVAVRTPFDPALRTMIEAERPSGLAFSPDGTLFVSETSAGRILQVKPDGSYSVFADGLHFPTALALDPAGNLYVVVAPDSGQWEADHPPTFGDRILQFKPDGSFGVFARLPNVRAIAVGPDENIYATAHEAVYRISSAGSASRFAEGFEDSVGLAFDLAGNLYISDEHRSSIVRIGGFPQGTLSGVVVGESGAPVEGARVQVFSVDPIVVGQVVFSDPDGIFSLPAAPRMYSIIVTADGYEDVTLDAIEITADQDMVVEIELEEQ